MANNVLVNNLCSWPLYFNRANGMGTFTVPANAKNWPLLSYDEVQAQIQLGNKMFTGTDGQGSHARIQIVDDAQRKELFGVGSLEKVELLTPESVTALLAMKSKNKFAEKLRSMVQTDAEKRQLLDLAAECGSENAEAWKVDALREIAETVTL